MVGGCGPSVVGGFGGTVVSGGGKVGLGLGCGLSVVCG